MMSITTNTVVKNCQGEEFEGQTPTEPFCEDVEEEEDETGGWNCCTTGTGWVNPSSHQPLSPAILRQFMKPLTTASLQYEVHGQFLKPSDPPAPKWLDKEV